MQRKNQSLPAKKISAVNESQSADGKADLHNDRLNPFVTFSEWSSETDEKAYASLNASASTSC